MELIDSVVAGSAVLTGFLATFIDVGFAAGTRESYCAFTLVTIHLISTCAPIQTETFVTIVDVDFAAHTSETTLTSTIIMNVRSCYAGAAISTRDVMTRYLHCGETDKTVSIFQQECSMIKIAIK